MNAQRAMLDLDARNVAAAQAATPGHPYQRLVAHLVETDNDEPMDDAAGARAVSTEPGTGRCVGDRGADRHARWRGAYEADASIFDIGKRLLAERTLDTER